MSLRVLMTLVFGAAAAAGLAMMGILAWEDIQLVRGITGDVEPGAGFWSFLALGSLLVLVPAGIAWAHLAVTQSRRITRIGQYLDEIGSEDPDKPGPLVPLRLSDDEAGRLSAAYNGWQARFREEMRGYRTAREELIEIDREKSEFLSIVSHELRTPLNTIIGFSQLLIDGIEGDLTESQQEDVRIVQTSGKNLLGLINDILDLSAIESGTIQIETGRMDIGELVREVEKEFRGQLEGKRASLQVVIADEPLVAIADRRRVYQTINNLVSNAVKFTPRGTITLEARRSGDDAQITVSDTGAGIPEGDLDGIFDEFGQAGTSTMRSKGTGLGLAICKKLVELQGGTIGVESVLGEGSTFRFTIPLAGSGEAS